MKNQGQPHSGLRGGPTPKALTQGVLGFCGEDLPTSKRPTGLLPHCRRSGSCWGSGSPIQLSLDRTAKPIKARSTRSSIPRVNRPAMLT